mmetsp:Transcript_18952/g.45770  ORF Transcript_18952/g.45770 Transcript_18952/m.45770 type:complete len:108 (+) Transcript_18952:117-440(+)
MTTTTTHENPIRRIDLVHHPTIDSKEKKDPYKYGEGVAARPFRYGFASVDRAIERKERLEEKQQQQQQQQQERRNRHRSVSITTATASPVSAWRRQRAGARRRTCHH